MESALGLGGDRREQLLDGGLEDVGMSGLWSEGGWVEVAAVVEVMVVSGLKGW